MDTNQTSTNQTNMKSKEQWIKEVQERLDWYTFQAAEEEFNAQEVDALVALLSTLKADTETPMPEPKVDFEAFMRYREMREADAQKRAALYAASHSELGIKGDGSEYGDSLGNMEPPRRFGGKILGGRHRFAKIASVAAILVMLTVGGAVGAVNAAKGGDFIMWLRKDKQGEKLVIEPSNNALIQAGQDVGSVYYDVKDVPEEYQQYLVDFDSMENLEGYELLQIEISEYKGSWRMLFLLQSETQEIYLETWKYENHVAVQENSFNGYEYAYNKNIDGVEFDFYKKPDNADGWDIMVSFFNENIQYFVSGNCSVEELESLAAECAEKILEKN